mgnify:CR=1 FL=1
MSIDATHRLWNPAGALALARVLPVIWAACPRCRVDLDAAGRVAERVERKFYAAAEALDCTDSEVAEALQYVDELARETNRRLIEVN